MCPTRVMKQTFSSIIYLGIIKRLRRCQPFACTVRLFVVQHVLHTVMICHFLSLSKHLELPVILQFSPNYYTHVAFAEGIHFPICNLASCLSYYCRLFYTGSSPFVSFISTGVRCAKRIKCLNHLLITFTRNWSDCLGKVGKRFDCLHWAD